MKITVAVFFGGQSVEHEVSIISGIQACSALDSSKYQPLLIYISKTISFIIASTGRHRSYMTWTQILNEVSSVPHSGSAWMISQKLGNNIILNLMLRCLSFTA